MVSKTPLVSVIVNCYNGEEYLAVALESVVGQSYQNWELILWDNFSTDNSARIVESFNEPRFKYFRATNFTSLPIARNEAIKVAKGAFICFLDVDDYWDFNKLKLQLACFTDPNVGVVSSYYNLLEERGDISKIQVIKPRIISHENLICEYSLHFSSVMIRMEALDRLEAIFNPVYEIIQDFDLIVRLALTTEVRVLNKPLSYYRWHGNNFGNSSMNKLLSEKEHWLVNNMFLSEKLNLNCLERSINWYKAYSEMSAGRLKQSLYYVNKLRSLDLLKFCYYFLLILLKFKPIDN